MARRRKTSRSTFRRGSALPPAAGQARWVEVCLDGSCHHNRDHVGPVVRETSPDGAPLGPWADPDAAGGASTAR